MHITLICAKFAHEHATQAVLGCMCFQALQRLSACMQPVCAWMDALVDHGWTIIGSALLSISRTVNRWVGQQVR